MFSSSREDRVETEMQIHGVNMDMLTNQPVIILKDLEAKRYLPIWIGQFEATAILMELQGMQSARPLTHDLMSTIVGRLRATLQKIVIDDIQDGTFFAKLHLANNGATDIIDARPSDAIALAVRLNAPIYASGKVVERATIVTEIGEEDEIEKFRDFLENIQPEDFKDNA